ncbi:anti-sigma factor [Ensifer sp. HO-A22]|uniref:Anti-sigma factor n=1 Tax=Ensifer oleiphilus TaxID=2742698 RepID=A0A7Y6UR67_9HYPH|nr:anti-sigma factor [Ensifer oleiphilus]NVD43215.1 anti-sigma factor [Ensifer oleiphilus]
MTYERTSIPDLADEYVLGLMEAADAVEIEAAMERDAELRAAVAASRERFLPLDATVEPVVAGANLWQKIEASLPLHTDTANPVENASANDNSRNGWRVAAISAIAASVILAVGLVYSLTRSVDPLVVAVLINEAGDVQAVVEDFGNEDARIRLLADFDVPADKTIQVWTLPSREMGPVSLGLVDGVNGAHLGGAELPKPRESQLYEITLEQTGGSPTGRPTGPILAKGFAKRSR